jgi:hypothetical protein
MWSLWHSVDNNAEQGKCAISVGPEVNSTSFCPEAQPRDKKTLNSPRVQQKEHISRVKAFFVHEVLQWTLRPSFEHHFLPLGGEKQY